MSSLMEKRTGLIARLRHASGFVYEWKAYVESERSLHTGEVVGSIPTAPTKKPLKIKHF